MAGNYPDGASKTFWSNTNTPASTAVVKATQTPAVPSNVVATGGKLYAFFGTTAQAAGYLQFFDSAVALVSGTTVPLFSYACPVGSTTPANIGPVSFTRAFPFTTGLQWAMSSTQNVYTAAVLPITLSVEYS